MKHLANKLKSRRGASLMFALLVFLFCLLAGTAALAVAAANAGRYAHLESEQQQYYSTASALALLQSALDDKVETDPIKIEVRRTETYRWQYDISVEPYKLNENTTTSYELVLPASGNLTYFQYQLFQHALPADWKTGLSPSSLPDFNGEYTVDLDRAGLGSPEPEWAVSLYPVHVTAKNAGTSAGVSPYALEMHLKTDGGAYPLKVVWSGEAVTEESLVSVNTVTDPGGAGGTRTTVTRLTCTLRWSAENRVVTFE